MDDRLSPGSSYFQYSPSPHNSIRSSSASLDRESSSRYLAELLAEKQKLGPFMQVLPHCIRLLNQEILLASALAPSQSFLGYERMDHESPLRSASLHSIGGPVDSEGWAGMQTEESGFLRRMGIFHASSMGWHGAPGGHTSPIVKKAMRFDVPVNKYPNYNFVGRLLGPRGNSLKRVEATTQCRVFIRGRGSVKDSAKEEKLRDKPGYEHLNEPLYVRVEAELPADVIDSRMSQVAGIIIDLLEPPVDESMDYYKKDQLRELAMLNGTLREDSPHMSPSVSPFNSTGMKRAKTGL